MTSHVPRALQAVTYEREAQEYLRSLPLEHFMEAIPQATQRAITVASLELVKARRPDVHVYNELLVQYRRRNSRKIEKVVPDNMVVISSEPITAQSSYNVPLEPAGPYWTLEYISGNNLRKDYEDSFRKYERDLKVPYYLVFHPEQESLTLYRHNGRKYAKVKANRDGRYPIAKLDMEVGLVDGWVRYWYRGELLPLPAEMQRELDEARRQQAEEKRRADEQARRADEQARRADEQARRADEQARRAEDEKRRADEERRRADEEKRRADEERQRSAALQQRLTALERELRGRPPT